MVAKFSGKKVGVFGMGRSGLSAVKLLSRVNAEVYAVSKGDPSTWDSKSILVDLIGERNLIPESNSSEIFSNMDVIILSPGIPKTHEVLKEANSKSVPIWSEIELGYHFAKTPIVAVTGTNGKTTTVSMIGDMIKNSSQNAFVGGNIGIPFCECILDEMDGKHFDLIILEVSSFQLETIHKFRPNFGVVLNIYPNHGERYTSVDEYAKAKFNISKNMTVKDFFIFPKNCTEILKLHQESKGEYSSLLLETADFQLIKTELENKYSLEKFKLQGEHNIINLFFAIKVVEMLNIDLQDIQKTIDNFKGVEHRIEYVETPLPFTAFNDAKSTNWDATLTAVKAIDTSEKELFLILGGKRRGQAHSIRPYLNVFSGKVTKIFLIGDAASDLAEELNGFGKISFEKSDTLDDVLEYLKKSIFKGVLLFSPAFPSFDQFKNYEKRGEYFKSLLK